jgi:hypothetical protein
MLRRRLDRLERKGMAVKADSARASKLPPKPQKKE